MRKLLCIYVKFIDIYRLYAPSGKLNRRFSKLAATKAKSDLKTEVSQKLNQGLPGNKLQVENKEGEIILKGTVASQAELKKAESLAKEVQGVKMVKWKQKLKL